MDVQARIRELMEARGWTVYMLAKKSGLHDVTVSNIFNRGTTPTIPTLEAICWGFGISMAEFFSEGRLTELSTEQQALLERWATLSPEKKKAVMELLRVMK